MTAVSIEWELLISHNAFEFSILSFTWRHQMTNFFKVNLESDLDAIYISCRLLVGNSCPKPGSVSLFSFVFYSVMSYFC